MRWGERGGMNYANSWAGKHRRNTNVKLLTRCWTAYLSCVCLRGKQSQQQYSTVVQHCSLCCTIDLLNGIIRRPLGHQSQLDNSDAGDVTARTRNSLGRGPLITRRWTFPHSAAWVDTSTHDELTPADSYETTRPLPCRTDGRTVVPNLREDKRIHTLHLHVSHLTEQITVTLQPYTLLPINRILRYIIKYRTHIVGKITLLLRRLNQIWTF